MKNNQFFPAFAPSIDVPPAVSLPPFGDRSGQKLTNRSTEPCLTRCDTDSDHAANGKNRAVHPAQPAYCCAHGRRNGSPFPAALPPNGSWSGGIGNRSEERRVGKECRCRV